MSQYVYVNPVNRGFKRVHLSKKDHNKVFPYVKLDMFSRYEYYISPKKFILHRMTSRKWVVLVTIGFPIVALLSGIANIRELLHEYYTLYNQKRLGQFSSDEFWSNSDTYRAVRNTLITTGQWD